MCGIKTSMEIKPQLIYVDDLAISSKSKEDVHAVMKLIQNEFMDVK